MLWFEISREFGYTAPSPSESATYFKFPALDVLLWIKVWSPQRGPLRCKYVTYKRALTWLLADTDTFISLTVWIAAFWRPRPREQEGRFLSWQGGVSLSQRSGYQPYCSQEAGEAAETCQVKGSPGMSYGDVGCHCVWVSLFLTPFQPVLPRTGGLTSERLRPDVWCIVVFVACFFISAISSSPAHEGWRGGQIELKSEISFLFFSVQVV